MIYYSCPKESTELKYLIPKSTTELVLKGHVRFVFLKDVGQKSLGSHEIISNFPSTFARVERSFPLSFLLFG